MLLPLCHLSFLCRRKWQKVVHRVLPTKLLHSEGDGALDRLPREVVDSPSP